MYISYAIFEHLANKFGLDKETIETLNQIRITAPDLLVITEPRFDYMNSSEGILTLLEDKFVQVEKEYSKLGYIFPTSMEDLESKPALLWLYDFPAKLNYHFKKELLEKENYVFIREHDEDQQLKPFFSEHPLFVSFRTEMTQQMTRGMNSTIKYETRLMGETLQGYSLIVERRLKDLASGLYMSEDPGEYELNYWISCYNAFSKLLTHY